MKYTNAREALSYWSTNAPIFSPVLQERNRWDHVIDYPSCPTPFYPFHTHLSLMMLSKVLSSPLLAHFVQESDILQRHLTESHEIPWPSLFFFFFWNPFQSSWSRLAAIISWRYLVWISNAWCASWKLRHVPAALSPVLFKGSVLAGHGHPHILDTGCHEAKCTKLPYRGFVDLCDRVRKGVFGGPLMWRQQQLQLSQPVADAVPAHTWR